MRRRLTLTSLIDVIFLLLLFFMLTSTFSTYGEIELSQATAGSAAPGVPTERLFVQIGAERLVLNGAPITLDELATQVEAGQFAYQSGRRYHGATAGRSAGARAGARRAVRHGVGVTP